MRLAKMIWWWINKEDYHMGDTVTKFELETVLY